MAMRVIDLVSKEQKKQLQEMSHRKKRPSKKKKEEKVNWQEIMGMNRDTYKRGKGGAIRRK